MVQGGKERALRTKVHFNSIVLLDGLPLPNPKPPNPTIPCPPPPSIGRHTSVGWHNHVGRGIPGKVSDAPSFLSR